MKTEKRKEDGGEVGGKNILRNTLVLYFETDYSQSTENSC